MINILIAYDNQNHNLGRYFEDCKSDLINFLDEHGELVNSISEIPSIRCNVAYIDLVIPKINQVPFIFVAYTHGISDGLRCNGDSFVSTENTHHFENSLFYTTACLSGRILAPDLINKGCKAFIGFKEESEVFENNLYRQLFIECDNYALKKLISTNATIGESYDSTKRFYSSKIDKLIELGEDPLYIAALVANKEALICIGDKNLKKEDIFSH